MAMFKRSIFFVFSLIIFSVQAVSDAGTLSDNIRIESKKLGYALQYRVYTPNGYDNIENLPALYVTDGQWYLNQGQLHKELDKQIESGAIKPIIAVFIDSQNPDNLRQNRRNQQFFCNTDYANFFKDELVPAISANYKASSNREDRVILGMSFGGLNAACFGVTATETFKGIAMQSPAMHPVPKLYDFYRNSPTKSLNIFFSIGTQNDNTQAGREFKKILEEKNYELSYIEVPYGHSWKNWKPLLDDVLLYFFKP